MMACQITLNICFLPSCLSLPSTETTKRNYCLIAQGGDETRIEQASLVIVAPRNDDEA